jgi:hypothetical protein
MDFVWIYAKKFSSWYITGLFHELDYSIRSVKKNYTGEVRCFVVGDDPGLDGITHIPAPLVTHSDIEKGKHLDNMSKMSAILSNSDINEEFVIMYDDIFILQPTSEEEIKKTYAICEVEIPEDYVKTRTGGTPYKKFWLDTYNYIITYRYSKGLKTYDWETHLPRFLVKSNLKWLINSLNLRNIPRIYTSMYAAHFSEETFIIPEGFQSDIWTHKPGMDFDKEFACRHMNIGDNVIVPEFIERMQHEFGK